MKIKYLSLFAGIGGFEYGMKQSEHKFKCISFSEVDKYATSIYSRHFPKHHPLGDATRIITEELEDFEFLVGGFPCQAFSIAGKRKGFNDTRGTLFFEIARILRDKRPTYFLLENVRGLLSHDRGRTLSTIFRILNELGYNVQWEIYNSKDYGVPQNRERIFLKGYLAEECGQKVLSVRRDGKKNNGRLMKLNKGIMQGYEVYDNNGISKALTSNSGGLGGKTGLYKVNASEKNSTGKLLPLNKKKQAQTVFDVNGLAMTLCANGGGQGGKTGLYKMDVSNNTNVEKHFTEINNDQLMTTTQNGNAFSLTTRHRERPLSKKQDNYVIEQDTNYQIRRLNPVECERLQGFPDRWTEFGKDGETISDTQRYKCLGNAVTTNVVTAIVNEMFREE